MFRPETGVQFWSSCSAVGGTHIGGGSGTGRRRWVLRLTVADAVGGKNTPQLAGALDFGEAL